MPGHKPKGHQKLGAAMKLLEKAPVLSVPQAMRAVGYSQAESESRSLQMQIRRRLGQASGAAVPKNAPRKSAALPKTVSVQKPPSNQFGLSSLTNESPPSPPDTKPPPKIVRPPSPVKFKPSVETKQNIICSQQRESKNHASAAHKHATKCFANEKGKKGGKTAAEVAEATQKMYGGVGPSARTIQRYVKDGRIGTSPLRRGRPGTLPEFVFECNARVDGSVARVERSRISASRRRSGTLGHVNRHCSYYHNNDLWGHRGALCGVCLDPSDRDDVSNDANDKHKSVVGVRTDRRNDETDGRRDISSAAELIPEVVTSAGTAEGPAKSEAADAEETMFRRDLRGFLLSETARIEGGHEEWRLQL